MPLIARIVNVYTLCAQILNRFAPIADLAIRIWLFKSFFFSGWLKTKNWNSTLSLFANEYQVPLLSPEIAAYLGTAAELTLPIFVLLGLMGRLSAFALFVFNIVILLSYPFLWTDDGLNGLHQHITWGLLMLTIIVYGPGKLSMDYLLQKKCPGYVY
jgi:putative oxidoreductase